MEYEVDLSRYVRALVRRWPWMILAAVTFALVAALVSLFEAPTYTATASVFFRPTRSQLRLDERFVTDETIDAASRRTTLLTLARSPNIEASLPAEELKRHGLVGGKPGDLASRIGVRATGDLINILATGSTPEQARSLADMWAAAFVKTSNQLYTDMASPVNSEQVAEVEARYEAAQQAFEQFVGSSRIAELEQRIAATTSVISSTLEAEQSRYNTYLARANQIELVLRDAEALRGQLAAGSSAALGDSIALLTLRARLSSGVPSSSSGQPVEQSQSPVQLQIALPAAIERGEGVTLQDVDALIGTLRREIEATRTAVAEVAAGLADEGRTSASGVTGQDREAYYTQLADLLERREAEEGRQVALEQERNLALETLQVARRKAAEHQVAAIQPDAEVRVAGSALLPLGPDGPGTAIMAGVGGLAGMSLAVLLIILLEAFGSAASPSRVERSTERSPAYTTSTAEQV